MIIILDTDNKKKKTPAITPHKCVVKKGVSEHRYKGVRTSPLYSWFPEPVIRPVLPMTLRNKGHPSPHCDKSAITLHTSVGSWNTFSLSHRTWPFHIWAFEFFY